MKTRICPGVRWHIHPTTPGVSMWSDRQDPVVRVVSEEYGRTLTQYLTRRQAARLLAWWRASR